MHRNRWDDTVHPSCSFCKQTIETSLHLFVQCEITSRLWNAISKWLAQICQTKVTFTAYKIILNKSKDKDSEFIDTIIVQNIISMRANVWRRLQNY